MTEPRLGKAVRILLAITVWIAILGYVFQHRQDLRRLEGLPVHIGGAAIGIRILGHLAQGIMTWRILSRLSPKLRYWEWMRIAAGGSFLSALIPLAGFGLKATYLHQNHRLSPLHTAGALLYLAAVRLGAAGSVAVAGLLLYHHHYHQVPGRLWGLAFLTASLGAGIGVLPLLYRRLALPKPPRRLHALHEMQPKLRGQLGFTFGWAVVRSLLAFGAFGLIFYALAGEARGFWSGGVVTCLSAGVKLTKLTPGNLGILEAAGGVVGTWFGYAGLVGLTTAAISRVLGYGAMLAVAGAAVLIDGRRKVNDASPTSD